MITLNRPKALNALNLNMIRKIYPVLQVCQSKQKVALIFFQLILKYYRMVQQFKCLNCIVTVVTLSEKDHLWIWRWNIERSHWLIAWARLHELSFTRFQVGSFPLFELMFSETIDKFMSCHLAIYVYMRVLTWDYT